MDGFWKAAAVMILTIILGVSLGKSEKEFAIVLSVTACCMVVLIAMQYLSEVITFLWKLGDRSSDSFPFLETLLKITGVALVTELTGMISTDAGNSSLGKAMQILGVSVILFLSLPLFESLLTIVQEILRLL